MEYLVCLLFNVYSGTYSMTNSRNPASRSLCLFQEAVSDVWGV
jgi:hypothetical protein